jgi:hypothetical protein
MPTKLAALLSNVDQMADIALRLSTSGEARFSSACWDVATALEKLLTHFDSLHWSVETDHTKECMRKTLLALSGNPREASGYYVTMASKELASEMRHLQGTLGALCSFTSLRDKCKDICVALAAGLRAKDRHTPARAEPPQERVLHTVENGNILHPIAFRPRA